LTQHEESRERVVTLRKRKRKVVKKKVVFPSSKWVLLDKCCLVIESRSRLRSKRFDL